MKKITTKNYLILLGLVFITFIICFYMFSWLKQYSDAKLKDPIILEIAPEVKYNNLDSFIKERNFFVLYLCTSSEKTCRSFETNLKKYIIEEDIVDHIVYLNLGERRSENDILTKIYNNYKHPDLKKKINSYPTLLIFSNGKIIDLLSPNKHGKISMEIVEKFFESYDFI